MSRTLLLSRTIVAAAAAVALLAACSTSSGAPPSTAGPEGSRASTAPATAATEPAAAPSGPPKVAWCRAFRGAPAARPDKVEARLYGDSSAEATESVGFGVSRDGGVPAKAWGHLRDGTVASAAGGRGGSGQPDRQADDQAADAPTEKPPAAGVWAGTVTWDAKRQVWYSPDGSASLDAWDQDHVATALSKLASTLDGCRPDRFWRKPSVVFVVDLEAKIAAAEAHGYNDEDAEKCIANTIAAGLRVERPPTRHAVECKMEFPERPPR